MILIIRIEGGSGRETWETLTAKCQTLIAKVKLFSVPAYLSSTCERERFPRPSRPPLGAGRGHRRRGTAVDARTCSPSRSASRGEPGKARRASLTRTPINTLKRD